MMSLTEADYIAPATVGEVCSLLNTYGREAKILAGGTDLLVEYKLGISKPGLIISLGKILGLKGICQEGECVKIGAMTRLHEVRYNPLILNHYPALAEAAAAVGAVQLQHMGTVGGNLCLNTRCIYYNQSNTWRKSHAICLKMGGHVCHVVPKGKKCYAVFSGDIAPALIALDAQVKLISTAGERVVPVCELYTGDGREPIALHAGEVLAEIMIPLPINKQHSTYLKYRQRGAIDFPLTGVAAKVVINSDGICTDSKLVLTAIDSAPREVFEASELLKGKTLGIDIITQVSQRAMEAARPVANTPGSTPAYRRKMVEILTLRALTAIAKSLGGKS
jgi:4-hydroxybenzoyl-CoA reductase subunit beta